MDIANNQVLYRRATVEDLEAIIGMDKSVWGDPGIPDGLHAWRVWIDHAVVFVARLNNCLIGVCLVFPSTQFAWEDAKDTLVKKPVLALHKIFVLPGFQGRSVGFGLIRRTKTELDTLYPLGYRLELTVRPDNFAALALYARTGFVVGRTEKNYYGYGKDRQIMVFDKGLNRQQS